MLVVTRKKGERLRVGDVVITLVEVCGEKARIGIQAPKDVAIWREEIDRGQPSLRAIQEATPCA